MKSPHRFDLTRRRVVQLGLATLALPAALPAHAQISMATAINRMARFRALSQRCAKAYVQAYLEVLPESARDVLASAQRLIQVGFEDLAKAKLAAPVQQQLLVVQQESVTLGQLTAVPPSRQAVVAVAQQSDRMLLAANAATEALEAQARQPSARLVNVAGRQRMLSQRLARNYFLSAAGADSKALRDQMSADRAAFVEAMKVLADTPLSTNAIRNEMALGQQQWLLFDASIAHKPDANSLSTVATTSERVLEVMNNLTVMYEAALRDLLGTT